MMKSKTRKGLLPLPQVGRAAFSAGAVGVAVFLLLASWAKGESQANRESPTQTAGHVTISAGDLTVTFADNSAFGEHHRAGYNGIAELRHKEQPENVFVPLYAGFNLEHVFGGDHLEQLFEPRSHPMTLKQVSDWTVVLHQSPTPLSSVETTITFTVTPPHYIDICVEHIAHKKDFFKHGYLGTFWASYINAPDDKRIYFLGTEPGNEKPHWISAFSEKHGFKSTHLPVGEKPDLFFAEDFNASLASHFSDYRFSQPFFYGRFRNMVLTFMFDRSEGFRFSQSPTGGGDKNPAWDFQFIVRNPEVGKPYSFRARLAYKPLQANHDALTELEKWSLSHPRE
jgi:hypothetical protein